MPQKFINSLYISFIIILISFSARSAEDLKSIGKFKDWETFTVTENDNKICFAQSIPILRAPKKFERNSSRLFITFRPSEDIKDEVSATSGYTFQKEKIVKAKTGKKTYDFFSQEEFAWILDTEEEQRFIKAMKKASRVMIIGRTEKGKQTVDHYSLMGFTKAYNTAKKNCS
ncbi:uncharacterized protein METZ01_LOCUS96729 [marine metagenome]|uniref:Uncharacterized protein n=1 Tax=marine metagenome TaxID=408172 RepID=A0A381VUC0_9ZZZZ